MTMAFMLLVIASFVLFFTDRSHMGFNNSVDLGTLNGRKITRQEYLNAEKEAMLMHFFRFGDWPSSGSRSEMMGWRTEEQTRQRLVLIEQMKQFGIVIGDEAVAKEVAQLFHNANSNKSNVLEQYHNMIDNNLKPHGLSEEDFRRFIRNELGLQQLSSFLGASGRLLTPAVAEAAYRHDNQRVETKAVSFLATNFVAKAKADIDPKALSQYYSNQVQNYNLPVRVQVSYVAFESLNFLAEAAQEMAKNTNINTYIEQMYKQRGAEFFKDEKGTVLSPEKAKEKLRDEARAEFASNIARKKAYEFATKLHDTQPLALNNLATLAGKEGLKLFETEPFSVLDGPKGIKDSTQFARQAFGLNQAQPFSSEPVEAGTDYYVLGFKSRLPSVPQPFEAVKDKVQEDYVQTRAIQLARDAAKKFALAVTNGLASGKKFVDVAREQKVSVVNIAPFARQATSIPDVESLHVSPFQIRSAAFAHKAGESSGFISSGDGGFVLYVDKFLPADEAKMQEELKDNLENLRSRSASIAFGEWFGGLSQITGGAAAEKK